MYEVSNFYTVKVIKGEQTEQNCLVASNCFNSHGLDH